MCTGVEVEYQCEDMRARVREGKKARVGGDMGANFCVDMRVHGCRLCEG